MWSEILVWELLEPPPTPPPLLLKLSNNDQLLPAIVVADNAVSAIIDGLFGGFHAYSTLMEVGNWAAGGVAAGAQSDWLLPS